MTGTSISQRQLLSDIAEEEEMGNEATEKLLGETAQESGRNTPNPQGDIKPDSGQLRYRKGYDQLDQRSTPSYPRASSRIADNLNAVIKA